MFVSEFMTPNPITITSDTPVVRVARLLNTYNVRRLPVVDDGCLVGLIGEKAVAAALPSAATALTGKEMSDTLSHIIVRNVMRADVVTVTPDMTAESALALAQQQQVGCLVVLGDQEDVIGIVTTNDFIYRILNPLLGLGKPGVRLHITDCGNPRQISEVAAVIEKQGLAVAAFHLDDSPRRETRDLIVQVVTADASELISDLASRGYAVDIRKRIFYQSPEPCNT